MCSRCSSSPTSKVTSKKLAAELKKQGYTNEQFRADLRALALRDALEKKITKDVKVDAAAIKANYEQNKTQYTVPESRDVRHILLSVRKKDGAVDYRGSRALADDVYGQLENGGDFAALAKKYSQDPGSKDNGGKYTVARGQTVAPFEQTAFNLEVGELSRPIKTEYGYHLIEPLGARQAGSRHATRPRCERRSRRSSLEQAERSRHRVGRRGPQGLRRQGPVRRRVRAAGAPEETETTTHPAQD